MKISITRPLIAVAAAALLSSCMGEKFHVEGNVKNAKDSVLYFEHNGLEGFTVVDSVKLDETGTFAFSGDGTKCPDFYRLRIAGQIINVAIDSTETVSVEASYPMMASNYKVTGSAENEKIRELALSQMALQSRCQALASDNSLSPDSTVAAIKQAIDAYKEHLRKNYIYKEPMRAYAYLDGVQPEPEPRRREGVCRRGNKLGYLLSRLGARTEPAQHRSGGHEEQAHHRRTTPGTGC